MQYFDAENYKWIEGEEYKKKVFLSELKEKIDLVEDVVINSFGNIPSHEHEFTDELFYILDGKGKIRLKNRDDINIKDGDLIKISRKEAHSFINTEKRSLRMLCFKINHKKGDSYLR